jgi:hypothetical protein|tara:strand:- start:508 stop:939 length:432 start_codon:yes stop_codon:yes gene_type:complete
MITDSLLRVSEDQAVTSTAYSTNTIDLSAARDVGEGTTLYMNFALTEAFANGTNITFEVVTSANANLSSHDVVGSSTTIATAALTLGKNIVVAINPQIASKGKRYLGARYVVTGTMNAGKVTADVVETIGDGQKYYASGFTVA